MRVQRKISVELERNGIIILEIETVGNKECSYLCDSYISIYKHCNFFSVEINGMSRCGRCVSSEILKKEESRLSLSKVINYVRLKVKQLLQK